MSSARSHFVALLGHYKHGLSSPALARSLTADSNHNEPARMLRNGLCVSGFVILESFLRARAGECLATLSQSSKPFADLPESLKRSASVKLLGAIAARSRIYRRSGLDDVAFAQEHAGYLASTQTSAYTISSLMFGGERSNLTTTDVRDFLQDLEVPDPWGQIGQLAARCGLGGIPTDSSFNTAAQFRHKAAHDDSADIELSHLRNFADHAIAVAIGFDLMATCAVKRLMNTVGPANQKTTHSDVRMRFVVESHGAHWRELREGVSRARRIHPSKSIAVQSAGQQAMANGESLIVQDARSVPIDWRSYL